MITVANKHIVVLGAARSGVGVARLLQRKGGDVFVSDNKPIEDRFKKQLAAHDIAFEEGGHTEKVTDGDFLVLSPGVPTQAAPVQAYLKIGKKVFSELEVASWFNQGSMVAVTGSNGKTTVTNWLDHIWLQAGRDHITAGNVGEAFSASVERSTKDKTSILEVSSFQLDHIDTFHPDISLLLNITPDHLDRYDGMLENYVDSKFRIIENQNSSDWMIYHYDDTIIKQRLRAIEKNGRPGLLAFSSTQEVPQGAFIREGQIIIKLNNQEEKLMPVEAIKLKGTHNIHNGLAAALAARASEISNEVIRESLRSFEGVEHRLEKVRTVDGVDYVNDSKATNINAVWYALDSFNVPVVLILGGRDKGNDYTELADQIREKVHTVVAVGEATSIIEEQLKGVAPNFEKATSMDEAVKVGREKAKRGEVVLLSPACSSFDMFDNYKHRGEVFKKAVNKF